MNNIFVDPVIVTTPLEDESREDVEKWVKALTAWLKEASSSYHQWFHCVQATNLLANERRFPSFEILRAWQRKYKLDINPSFIVKDINTFFRNETLDLSNRLSELGYLIEAEKDSITTHPEQFSSRWLECIREETLQVLLTTTACKYTHHPFAERLQIATSRLDDDTREVTVSATIIDALPDFVRESHDTIAQTFPLLFTPEDMPQLDIVNLWNQGENGIRKAVEQQYKQDWASSTTELLPYRFGPHFIESITDRNNVTGLLLHQIVNTMARVVANKTKEGKHDRHEYREREERGTPQYVRADDNAKAWRITITPDGSGWRMHYWQIPGGDSSDIIEFSNVLTKKDKSRIY